ncbi:MAG: hypothetical protein HWE24_11525 [Oceanospirillaceae bacterium]|nr:hypothetical protein [Oceanospirillaceae bacterium]
MSEIFAANYGVTPGLDVDMSDQLQDLLDFASQHGHVVILEPGVYNLSSDIILSGNVMIEASSEGSVVLKSIDGSQVNLRTNGWDGEVLSEGYIKGIIFDGVGVCLSGRVDSFELSSNAFINYSVTEENHTQLMLANGSFFIQGNVFLGSDDVTGNGMQLRAIGTYATEETILSENFIGGGSLTHVPDALHAQNIYQDLMVYYPGSLDAHTDSFMTGIGGSHDQNLTVERNFIYGDDEVNYRRDHAIYFHNFEGLLFLENTVDGWPDDASGGAKFRNGSDLRVLNNTFTNCPVLTYSYTDFNVGMSSVSIEGNVISSSFYPILYWENGTGTSLMGLYILNNEIYNYGESSDIQIMPRVDSDDASDWAMGILVAGNFTNNGQPSTISYRSGVNVESVISDTMSFEELHSNLLPAEDASNLEDAGPSSPSGVHAADSYPVSQILPLLARFAIMRSTPREASGDSCREFTHQQLTDEYISGDNFQFSSFTQDSRDANIARIGYFLNLTLSQFRPEISNIDFQLEHSDDQGYSDEFISNEGSAAWLFGGEWLGDDWG